jgi:predicted transcriptional regulator
MKIKKIQIGIKGIKEALDDFMRAGEAIEKGKKVKREIGIYFENIAAFRKALTPKRLELLHLIKTRHPKSLQEIARFARRNVKNIATDIDLLTQLGLIETAKSGTGRKEITSQVDYDAIELRIAV